jgi:hypothetical protein
MTPYAFGQKIAAGPGIQGMGKLPQPIPNIPKPAIQPAIKPPPAPDKLNLPSAWQTGGNMLANSGRVGTGALAALSGAVGTVGSGIGAGLTNTWNAATPKSMNTAPDWTQGINTAFNTSRNFANAGWNDVTGGLGGDTNYNQSKSWDMLQKGWQDPNLDATSRTIAQIGGYGGNAAWNLAQAVPAGVTAARGVMAPIRFVQNTFRPGFSQVRSALKNTARIYNDASGLPALHRAKPPLAPRLLEPITDAAGSAAKITTPVFRRMHSANVGGGARLSETARANAGGLYDYSRNTATSLWPRGTASGTSLMRHELGHALQAHTRQPASLQGVVQNLREAPGNWSQAAGRLLAEVHSNAAEARSIPGQMSNALKFLTSPRQARYYSNTYAHTPFARQYAALHNAGVAAPYVAGASGVAAGLAGARSSEPTARELNTRVLPPGNLSSPTGKY